MATIFVLQRRFADTIHHFDEAIRLDPQSVQSYTALGRLLQQAGQFDKAAARFEAALAADPNAVAAYVYLGAARLQQQRFDDAEKHFRNRPENAAIFTGAIFAGASNRISGPKIVVLRDARVFLGGLLASCHAATARL